MTLVVELVEQDEMRVRFRLLDESGKVVFDNPDFSKDALLELITEGNHDVGAIASDILETEEDLI